MIIIKCALIYKYEMEYISLRKLIRIFKEVNQNNFEVYVDINLFGAF
jgi:hypothetical protein